MSVPFVIDPSVAVLSAALVVDALWGEPPNALHPVVWIGKVVSWLEKLAPRDGAGRQLAAGVFIALAVPLLFAGASLLVTNLRVWPILWFVVSALLLKSTFSMRGLGRAAFDVRDALARGSLGDARQAL